MQRQTDSSQTASARSSQNPQSQVQPFRVLVVDPEPAFCRLLEQCANTDRPMQIAHVPTIKAARKRLSSGQIDLVVIEPHLPDGSGLELADDVHRRYHHTQTIMITEKPNLEIAIRAIRAGASDFMVKPLNLEEVNQRVHEVIRRQTRDRKHAQRVQRLRRACQKLNQARVDVSQQVDILCNDLVTAYQELACQMNQVAATQDYQRVIQGELDLQQLLRKTLEYLIEKAGPTNAAIFLPATADEYSLGGYVNYDCTSGTADIVLQHLAEVMAPKIASAGTVVHLRDDDSLNRWLGDDAAYLADSHMLAVPCQDGDECLAVLVLFRDASDPYAQTVIDACQQVGPTLGNALVKLIRVHHRHMM